MAKPNHQIIVFLLISLILPLSTRAKTVYSIYVPVIMKHSGSHGIEIWPGVAAAYPNEIAAARPNFVKTYLKWSEVEAIQGVYTWPVGFDNDYNLLHDRYGLIVVLKMAPAWARSDQRMCGRIADIWAFTEFARRAATRYPDVSIWEVWNEPDSATGIDDYYGCWGNPEETYYGGDYYATVINPVRAAIKQVNPNTQVYFGGLMLPLNTAQKLYFEGAVRAGAQFDGVSFHHYTWYPYQISPQAQVEFLREVMTRYNYMRPILLSETSMLYNGTGEPYESRQGQYVPVIFRETLRLSLQAFIWYALPDTGWNHSGLMEGARIKPAFVEFADLADNH